MSTIPSGVDLDLRHPVWCDRSVCTAPDALAQRGLTAADVSNWERDTHYSTPRVVAGDRVDVHFGFRLARDVNQPPADTADGLEITLTWPVGLQVIGFFAAPGQVPLLFEALDEYRHAFPVGGES